MIIRIIQSRICTSAYRRCITRASLSKMPCIPANASAEDFQSASYMVESVYRPTEGGVWFAMTTAESTSMGGNPQYWDVYILNGAHTFDALPFAYTGGVLPHRLGTFGDCIADSGRYATMEEYCQADYAGQWHRHWVGYSNQHLTLDSQWWCLDLYYQPPQLVYSPYWMWYLMIDQCDPSEYWKGRILYYNGMKVIGIEQDHGVRL